jgi:hypothetical protein
MFKGLDLEEIEEAEKKQMEKRLCVDMDQIKDYLKVRNPYSNKQDRGSFSISAVICEDVDAGCTDIQQDIKDLLDNMMFNLYIYEEEISFGDVHNIGKRPI